MISALRSVIVVLILTTPPGIFVSESVAQQRTIDRIELMPRKPSPFVMKDWKVLAQAYDRLIFDFNARGKYLPVIWWDNSRPNFERVTFGLPSYVGDPRVTSTGHEAINSLGAVLGATISGIDKAQGVHNWVLMEEQYFNRKNGENLVLNRTATHSGQSFWYEVWPHVLFYALVHRYPRTGQMEAIMKTTADRWYDACYHMGGRKGTVDFEYTAFDFSTMKPVDNGKWKEPDAAAGIGWLEYMAWVKWRSPKYLQAADWSMQFLHNRAENPTYEILMPYGAYLAARLNGELGRKYDVHKLLTWCFDESKARPGWGTIAEDWGGYSCHGLVGSITDGGGYAFAMNTFASAGALVPLVRYDDRYSRAIGKWMLNAANSARLFYRDALPDDHQSSAFWKDDGGVIAYEGLRKEWKGRSPYATGDPMRLGWGPTDLALYGGSYVGFFGGIVRRTNVEMILQLDCLATDFFHDRAYPTHLYYNPYDVAKEVQIDVGPKARDLYDAATDSFLKRNVKGVSTFSLAADTAAVLVVAPARGAITRKGNKRLINGVVVDYVTIPNRLAADERR
ncbi:MAG TPA: hypothetical protein VMZ30_00505 [Pyrinomonadaceae bacterium]|nr:hypothetical protein [Pyrinomonadaceae bacterium]